MQRKTIAVQKHAGVLKIAVLFLLTAAIQFAFAIQVGKFAYKGDVEDFENDTITVSDTMIALSNKIYAKTDFNVVSDTAADTPSIVLVIDNSGSMGSADKDVNGNRFTASKSFIDTVMAKYPTAEIGLVVFGRTLWFDPDDHPYSINFSVCETVALGGYIPLLRLNRTYAAMGNQTGYTLLQKILTTYNDGGKIKLLYQSKDELSHIQTNINDAFKAVQCAMASAVNPKENQYVVFFSDGEATEGTPPDAFTVATNMPTTFTVFFTGDATVPPTIQTYTTNVRANGYSIRNDSSRAWAYGNQAGSSALLSFLLRNVFSVITTSMPGNPAQLAIGTQTSTSWSAVDSSFIFPNLFPLTGAVTPFSATIRYRFPNGDTLHFINFYIKRQPAYRVTPAAMYEQYYWDRNLGLRNNNAPVAVINETMDSLELRVDYNPGTAIYNYTNIKVQVYNKLGAVRDNEVYTLSKGTNLFSVKFKRAVSTAPVPGNRVFEHTATAGDSLIAVFLNSENPALPLDTLRIAIPINITPIATLTSAVTRDLNGNGLIDHIAVAFSRKINLTNLTGAGFTVSGTAGAFHVDSITKVNDSIYLLCLTEIKTSIPQTSWTPDVSVSFVPDVKSVSNFHTTDGCPPVVWEVIKHIVDSDRKHDTVTIFMSEKTTNAAGGAFSITTLPSSVFHVWAAQGASFALADTIFTGISGFTKVIGDSILVFTMSNGKDLWAGNYVNIRDNNLIRDKAGNFPTADNQRVKVTIVISMAVLTSAVTRDLNGNGFIDHIEMTFSNNVKLTSAMSSSFLVRGNAGAFRIDSIIMGKDSTTYLLCLTEKETTLPQTSWTPDVSFDFIPDAQTVVNFRTTDGCPPVVWEVKKYIIDPDRRHDTVKIFMSEKITALNGGAFNLQTPPSDVFHVWLLYSGWYALADMVFAGITGFTKILGDSILVLTMSNGRDLVAGNYINIRDNNLIRDNAGNFPPADNKRVRVIVFGGDYFTFTIGPNPAHPALNHPEELKFEHNANAVNWAKHGEGTVISLKELSIPENPADAKNVKAYMKIIDVVGNPVNWCKTTDMFATVPNAGGTVAPAMNLYWNGLNNEGMTVAPGVYRVVVYIDYPGGSKISDARVISKIGIRH